MDEVPWTVQVGIQISVLSLSQTLCQSPGLVCPSHPLTHVSSSKRKENEKFTFRRSVELLLPIEGVVG